MDLNRWLADRDGWPGGASPPPVTLAALAEPAAWADTIDWSRSAARAVGAGHIYVNLRGRDPHGMVEPGAAVRRAGGAHARGIGAAHGPGDRASGWWRACGPRARRMQARGPRRLPISWSRSRPALPGRGTRMLGGMAAHAVAPNEGRWRAEHATVDERSVPGVWLSSMPLTGETMSVMDVAPTVLQYFGAAATAVIEGRGQLRDSPSSTSRR